MTIWSISACQRFRKMFVTFLSQNQDIIRFSSLIIKLCCFQNCSFSHCSCDQYSNCLPGNSKVIQNCTIFSPTVCKGCADGNYFDKDAGESGGCIKCSPPCGVFEKEEIPCNTQHDRLCTRNTLLQLFSRKSQIPHTTLLSRRHQLV